MRPSILLLQLTLSPWPFGEIFFPLYPAVVKLRAISTPSKQGGGFDGKVDRSQVLEKKERFL